MMKSSVEGSPTVETTTIVTEMKRETIWRVIQSVATVGSVHTSVHQYILIYFAYTVAKTYCGIGATSLQIGGCLYR